MHSKPRRSFGEVLRGFRVRSGHTQSELAQASGLSERGISDLERGISKAPWGSTIERLARALHLNDVERGELIAARRPSVPLPTDDASPISPSGAPQLVGRDAERSQLQQMLLGGAPTMLGFYGEPGIGKSRLLQEAEDLGRRLGWTVLRGVAEPLEEPRPYAPVVQALQTYLESLNVEQRGNALRGSERMAALLPELVDGVQPPVSAWQFPPEQERRLLFAAVERFLANMTEAGAVLLILDDVQWADADGLALLTHLLRTSVRSAHADRLRVVAAARNVRLPEEHLLPRVLADLARDQIVIWRPIGALSAEAAEELVRNAFADVTSITDTVRNQTIQRTLARGAGVPFFLTSLAREIRAQWLDGRQSAADETIPWDVAEMVRQRVYRLPETARALLNLLAVSGRQTALETLIHASGLPEKTVIDALEALYGQRLLVEAADGSATFAHDLVLEAVLGDISVARREALHERIAGALAAVAHAGSAEPLAYHYGRSAESELAVRYLEQAGDEAQSARAYGAAINRYQAALQRLAQIDSLTQTARLQEKLGALQMNAGHYDEALMQFEAAAASYRRLGDQDGAGRVAAQIGWAHVRRGSAHEGMRRLEPALAPALLESLSLDTQAALYRARSILLFAVGQYPEQLADARLSGALAREIGDQTALAQAMRMEGLALVLLGRLAEAAPVLEETIHIAEAVGDLDSYTAALNDAAAAHRAHGALAESWRYSLKAAEAIELLGDPMGRAFMASSHGEDAFHLGEWQVAREWMGRGVAVVREMGDSWTAPYSLADLGMLCMFEGRDEEAAELLGEALASAESSRDLQAQRTVQAILAERDLLYERPDEAVRRLEPLIQHSGNANESATLLPLLSWAHLRLGNVERASALLADCFASATANDGMLLLQDARLTQIRLLISRSDWRGALSVADQTIAAAQSMRCPFTEAKALYLRGSIHHQRGADDAAGDDLQSALSIFDRLGERFYSLEAVAELRRLS